MRILWVKVGGLWPPDRGGRLRSYHLLSELSRRHRVTLVTTHGPGDDPHGLWNALAGCERILSFPHGMAKHWSARFVVALAGSWLSGLPVDLWRARVPALRREVRRLMARGRPDVCVADFLAATPNVPLYGPVPVALFEHNVEYMIWHRLCRTEPRWWRRALLQQEWRKMRRWEARQCARAGVTVAVSATDREEIARLAPAARVREVPTGVDLEYFSPNGAPTAPGRLVFTGSMDWYPNEDAILHFIDAILPAIRREVPEVSLAVVGRNPTARLRAAASAAGVHVTGTVQDVRPFVAESEVYVVPLRVGGGTRLKIFEALAMGKAVVSTSIGAEGLPVIPGEHFLRADEAAVFARAVVTLLRRSADRRRLGLAGRALVEARYSWAEAARRLEAHLEEAASRGAEAEIHERSQARAGAIPAPFKEA
jgi:sugar transferase (PEP-CTERM/EpsH1 system associated)